MSTRSAAGNEQTRLAVALAQAGDENDLDSSLYADRTKIHPQKISGRFRRIKWGVLIGLLAIYYIAPWLRWDRGPGAPDQALLIDMPGRRAYFFWIEIWPQEVYYLAGILILAALALFLVTSVAGRVWCGFTCPQTVWTDLFMWVERLIEGDRNKRIRLDDAPFSASKAFKRTAKHAAWLVIALATGGAWIMYFNDAPTVARSILTGQASATVYGFVALFTATTYLLAGWAREQVCIYMCPWPRFQSAMFDEHSLLVTYESWRGEPRGHARPGTSPEGRGHCIDCGLCVRVCPTGVDIREGQQLACIGCGLCIDACNSIMAKMGWPTKLITYDSLSDQAARAAGQPPHTHFLRPRTLIYAGFLILVASIMAFTLSTRSLIELAVQPDRAPLFVKLQDGRIQNAYTLKITNKNRSAREFTLAANGLLDVELRVVGQESAETPVLPVEGDSIGTFRVFARANADSRRSETIPLEIVVQDHFSGETSAYSTIFNGPGR
jgi:cytochrome c oxidase accessory protein FixG